jgi:L-phenylalanine/L-methionine N-acetyltransferase
MDFTIRRAEPDDYEAIARLMGDARVYPGTLQIPFPSKEVWRKRTTELTEGDLVFVALAGDEIVGHAGIHPAGKSPRRAHAMHLGIVVAGDWQGRGVGTALMRAMVGVADGWLNVTRLELTVFADNAPAIALYRKFGFEVEGTHRGYALRDGVYADTCSMGRVRPKTPPV